MYSYEIYDIETNKQITILNGKDVSCIRKYFMSLGYHNVNTRVDCKIYKGYKGVVVGSLENNGYSTGMMHIANYIRRKQSI